MYKRLLKEIKLHKIIIIHRHQRPDGDALGSQFGLAQIIIENFKDKKVICVGHKEEYESSSLKRIFKEEFSTPTINEYKEALVIVVDTANIERIEGENFFMGDVVFKIDHHASGEQFGNSEILESDCSSTSEIISSFAKKEKLSINKKAAKFLLTGIITDTGRFTFNSVKPNTFDQASFLTKSGAKTQSIVSNLNDRDINFVRLQGEILSNFKFQDGVSYYMMPKNLHKNFDVSYNTASSLVFLLMSFSEANYALYATYDDENKI